MLPLVGYLSKREPLNEHACNENLPNVPADFRVNGAAGHILVQPQNAREGSFLSTNSSDRMLGVGNAQKQQSSTLLYRKQYTRPKTVHKTEMANRGNGAYGFLSQKPSGLLLLLPILCINIALTLASPFRLFVLSGLTEVLRSGILPSVLPQTKV